MREINFLFVLLSCPFIVSANWHGSVTGKIKTVDVADGNNYGFRVTLNGSPKLCGNEHTWAYINEADSNYQTFVAVLLAAKAAQFDVRLFTTRKNNTANGYCRIGYISVN